MYMLNNQGERISAVLESESESESFIKMRVGSESESESFKLESPQDW